MILNVLFVKLQQLLYFHPRTKAFCNSSETVDDMKLDSSSDTDSSSGNTYSSSEENSDNVTFHRWQIVEKKLTKSKVLTEHIYIKRRQVSAYHEIKASLSLSENDVMLHVDFAES